MNSRSLAARGVSSAGALGLISRMTAGDCLGRGSVLLAGGITLALMAAIPWLAVFALGDEIDLMEEMCLANLAVAGALVGVLCSQPAARAHAAHAAHAADTLLHVAPLPSVVISFGRWIGIAAVITVYSVIWMLVFCASMWLFADILETRFTLSRETDAWREMGHLLPLATLGTTLSILLSAVALASTQWRRGTNGGGIGHAAVAVVALAMGSFAVHAYASGQDTGRVLQALCVLVPDTRLYWPDAMLYGDVDWHWVAGGVLQAFAYGAAMLLLFRTRPR